MKHSNELVRCFVLYNFTNLDESVLDELVQYNQPNRRTLTDPESFKHYLNRMKIVVQFLL
jgi:hypothetical protein